MPVSFTTSVGGVYPDGAVALVYASTAYRHNGGPSGPPITFAVVGGASVTFPNLQGETSYFATADVDGSPRYVFFTTGEQPAATVTVSGVLNVKTEFGAVGDGVTNDRVAIQAALDATQTLATGGTVVIPPGRYLIGSPGLVWPASATKGIRLQGTGGIGISIGEMGSEFIRNGAYPIITWAVTGVSSTAGPVIEGMSFTGSTSQASPLLDMVWLSNGYMRDCRLFASGAQAIKATSLWNFHFHNVFTTECGSASVPAWEFNSYAPAVYGTNTVLISDCEWEGNNGTDILTDGATAALACVGVQITTCKFERSSGSAWHAKRVVSSGLVNSYIQRAETSASTVLFEHPDSFGGGNKVSDNSMAVAGTVKPYHIDGKTGGDAVIMGNTFYGSNGTACIRLQAGFGKVACIGNLAPTWASATILSDLRTTQTGPILN